MYISRRLVVVECKNNLEGVVCAMTASIFSSLSGDGISEATKTTSKFVYRGSAPVIRDFLAHMNSMAVLGRVAVMFTPSVIQRFGQSYPSHIVDTMHLSASLRHPVVLPMVKTDFSDMIASEVKHFFYSITPQEVSAIYFVLEGDLSRLELEYDLTTAFVFVLKWAEASDWQSFGWYKTKHVMANGAVVHRLGEKFYRENPKMLAVYLTRGHDIILGPNIKRVNTILKPSAGFISRHPCVISPKMARHAVKLANTFVSNMSLRDLASGGHDTAFVLMHEKEIELFKNVKQIEGAQCIVYSGLGGFFARELSPVRNQG